jgi:hypothetical protein
MEVDDYLKKQKSPQKEICTKLRKLIKKAIPGISEEMKYGVPWYGGKFYIVALKDHVNLGFCVGGLSKDEMALFEGKGKLMRHLKFATTDIDEKKIRKMLKMVNEKESSC